jgi:hypothetical protein
MGLSFKETKAMLAVFSLSKRRKKIHILKRSKLQLKAGRSNYARHNLLKFLHLTIDQYLPNN